MSEQIKIIEKIQKLLALAGNNSNEAEAAAAAAKAQEMLETYNLDMAEIEGHQTGDHAQRTNEKTQGAFYRYQTELWSELANINFCTMFTGKTYVPMEERVRNVKYKRYFKLVGRKVNVQITLNLGNYLLAAIERLTKDACKVQGEPTTGRWAMSFREGCTLRLRIKLRDRRRQREQEQAKAKANSHGSSDGRSLMVVDYAEAEADANNDFIFGYEPGTTAARRKMREAQAQAANAEREQWERDNPEKAARQKAEQDARTEKFWRKFNNRKSYQDKRYGHVNHSAMNKGYDQADSISLDEQVEYGKGAAKLG